MPEILPCPQCQRKLHLPDGFEGDMVQCPVCGAQFPALSAIPVGPPAAVVPPSADPREVSHPATRTAGRRPKRASGRTLVVVLAVLGVVGLVVAIGGVGVLYNARRPLAPDARRLPQFQQEDPDDRAAEVRRAFNQKPLAENEIAPELKPLFDGLGFAICAADADRIAAFFDAERMTDEFAAAMAVPPRSPQQRRAMVGGVRQGIGRSFAGRAMLIQWKSSEIRNVKKLNDDEAVVIVRHENPTVGTLKMRWWVTRRDGTWKVYDMEDLDTGTRMSAMAAVLAEKGMGAIPETARAVQTLSEALQAVAIQNDADDAEKKLMQIARVKLPGPIEGLRFVVWARIHLEHGKFQEALDVLGKARALQPDMPILDLLEGVALNKLGKWDDARKHLESYKDLLGEDAVVLREWGLALRGCQRFGEAARAYRKSLDLDPKDTDAFGGLLSSLGGDDDKTDVGRRFLELDDPRGNFDTFAEDCERRAFPELLEPLVLAMKKRDPEHLPVDYYLALLRARTGYPDQAAPLFKAALARQADADTRGNWTKRFLEVMVLAGGYLEAYAVVPDARDAFRSLAAEAMKKYQFDALIELVNAHGKAHADDPLLPLYRAVTYERQGRYALADKTFVAALVKPPEQETLASFRASRVLARYHVGQALAAYRDVGPRADTFRQLADLLLQDRKDDLLEILLDEHARNEPDSLDVLTHRCRWKIRQDRMAEAVPLFKAALDRPLSTGLAE